jgi:hypothetical protein
MESFGPEKSQQVYEQALVLAYQMVPGLESLSEGADRKREKVTLPVNTEKKNPSTWEG